MSVLLWWLPAAVILAVAAWWWRPRSTEVSDKDLRRVQRALDKQR